MKTQSESKQYTPSEVYYLASSNPVVFARVLRLPYLLASLLHWRSTSRTLLVHLVGVLENSRSWTELTHAELSASLWPDLHVESGKNKLARWLKAFDEDQDLSGFSAIARKRGRMIKAIEAGRDAEFQPSRYKVDRFFDFVEVVGCRVSESDALALATVKERNAQQRWICAQVLTEFGAATILPEVRGEASDRRQAAKQMARDMKKREAVKRGELALSVDELLSVESDSERFELLLGSTLQYLELLFTMLEKIATPEEAARIAARIEGKFQQRKQWALSRRYRFELNDRKTGVA